jgi:O-antigen/teichoic acid export membrane protein
MANLVAYAFVAFATLTLTYVLSPMRLQPALADKNQLRRWGSALLSFALISGMTTLSTQFATLLLGTFGEHEQVAYFRVAERGAQLVAFPLMFINAVLGPKIVAAHRGGERRALHALSRHAARMTLIVSAPLGLLLILFGKPLISMTFGEGYVAGGYVPLVALAIGQTIFVALGSPTLILAMSGHERENLVAQGCGFVVLSVLVLSLATPFGAVGVAIGVAIGLVVTKIVAVVFVYRRFAFFTGPF